MVLRLCSYKIKILEKKVPDLEIGLATVKDGNVILKAKMAMLSTESENKRRSLKSEVVVVAAVVGRALMMPDMVPY